MKWIRIKNTSTYRPSNGPDTTEIFGENITPSRPVAPINPNNTQMRREPLLLCFFKVQTLLNMFPPAHLYRVAQQDLTRKLRDFRSGDVHGSTDPDQLPLALQAMYISGSPCLLSYSP